ncbi:hypothetical protein [Tahibacter amnicola]|uniref:Uncharacterized protein n=1 Tax=Tahibacter amnicola TaxID=2976241 RepID=A0ABY6BDY7_9GAMM|nr:hypothetical protein [Tahibacter amnicola]UXI66535.1 hypothetical protein N4264_17500 [Tahibacter amnicola]
MKFLPTKKQWPVLILLMVLMLVTRYHPWGEVLHVKDASMAVFFAAGFYLGGTFALPLLLLQAGLIDYVSITQSGISDYCVTPAYSMLVVAYAVLWYGGLLFSRYYRQSVSTLLPLAGVALASNLVSFWISNGSFYWFGGRVGEATFAGYIENFLKYMPWFVTVSMLWIITMAAAHAVAVWGFGYRYESPRQNRA